MMNSTGDTGDWLQQRAKMRTEALKPPHKWVPWVVVDGIPLLNDLSNLDQYICAVYVGRRCGGPRPTLIGACFSHRAMFSP